VHHGNIVRTGSPAKLRMRKAEGRSAKKVFTRLKSRDDMVIQSSKLLAITQKLKETDGI
jgi:hypothetical protein